MARRFRRAKASPATCAACGRTKGDRKRAKCNRCPGQSVAASLCLEPVAGVRIVGIDPGATSAISVTSPTVQNRLEVCREIAPLSPDVDEVIDAAVQRSEDDGAPLWVAIEEPGMGGPRATPAMLVGLGQWIGMFRRAAVLAGVPDKRVIIVRQITWQAGALPQVRSGGDREGRVASSIDVARLVWGTETLSGSRIEWTADRAASALLAWFVPRWPPFVDAIGVRDRESARLVAAGSTSAAARPFVPARDARIDASPRQGGLFG